MTSLRMVKFQDQNITKFHLSNSFYQSRFVSSKIFKFPWKISSCRVLQDSYCICLYCEIVNLILRHLKHINSYEFAPSTQCQLMTAQRAIDYRVVSSWRLQQLLSCCSRWGFSLKFAFVGRWSLRSLVVPLSSFFIGSCMHNMFL